MNRCNSVLCSKKVKFVSLVLGLLGLIILLLYVSTCITTSVIPSPQDANLPRNTGIIFATDNVNIGSQYVWLADLTTHWYTSFDIKLISSDSATLSVYAVPSENLVLKGLATNLTCNCHANLKQCTIDKLPDYGVAPVNTFLFAGYQFIYNVCVSSSVSDAITLQAYLFEISNESDYSAFNDYLNNGNASSALFSSDVVTVEGTIFKQTCVVLSINVPKSASYVAVTSITMKPDTGPILYMKQCSAVVPDLIGLEYIQDCLVNSYHPVCTVPVPGHKNFISNILNPQMLSIVVKVSPSYSVPSQLQINATATNSNISSFTYIVITAAFIVAVVLSLAIALCVAVARCFCNKNTTQ